MDIALLDTILDTVATACTGNEIQSHATSLYGRLIVIDFILAVLFTMMSFTGPGFLQLIFRKILLYGFWLYIIKSWPSLMNLLMESFVIAGGNIGGDSGTILSHPSEVIAKGISFFNIGFEWFTDNCSVLTWQAALCNSFMIIPSLLGAVAAFGILGFQMFITYLEFYFSGALLLLFIPFGTLSYTSRYADAVVRGVIASGVKLMYMQALISVTMSFINGFQVVLSSPEASLYQLLAMTTVPWAMTYFAWEVPDLAASVMSGTTALSLNSVTRNVVNILYRVMTLNRGTNLQALQLERERQEREERDRFFRQNTQENGSQTGNEYD